MAKSTIDTTDNIIEALGKIDNLNMSNEDELITKNKIMCRLINIQLREFYDDIYIPYNFFKDGEWNISKILYNNEDSLFYNKKYLTKEDEERFYHVFSKYVTMLEDIFSPDNRLQVFLRNWTDMNHDKWKTNGTKSYLKSILTDRKYQVISPLYVVNIYCECAKKFNNDRDKIKNKLESHLDDIVKNIKKEARLFKEQYHQIVSAYVYEHPIENDTSYILGFINSIILLILDFAEKLIDLNVYAVHPIVQQIIEYYTPLDEINTYRSSDNTNKKLCIV